MPCSPITEPVKKYVNWNKLLILGDNANVKIVKLVNDPFILFLLNILAVLEYRIRINFKMERIQLSVVLKTIGRKRCWINTFQIVELLINYSD